MPKNISHRVRPLYFSEKYVIMIYNSNDKKSRLTEELTITITKDPLILILLGCANKIR